MSYKGTTWKKHIYTVKRGNTYVYPENYRENLQKKKSEVGRFTGREQSHFERYDRLTNLEKAVYRAQSRLQNAKKSKQAVKGVSPSLQNAAQKGYTQAQSSYKEKMAIKRAIVSIGTMPISKAMETTKTALGIKSVSSAIKGANAISGALKSIGSRLIKKN